VRAQKSVCDRRFVEPRSAWRRRWKLCAAGVRSRDLVEVVGRMQQVAACGERVCGHPRDVLSFVMLGSDPAVSGRPLEGLRRRAEAVDHVLVCVHVSRLGTDLERRI
jgi:hypothetical protein